MKWTTRQHTAGRIRAIFSYSGTEWNRRERGMGVLWADLGFLTVNILSLVAVTLTPTAFLHSPALLVGRWRQRLTNVTSARGADILVPRMSAETFSHLRPYHTTAHPHTTPPALPTHHHLPSLFRAHRTRALAACAAPVNRTGTTYRPILWRDASPPDGRAFDAAGLGGETERRTFYC